MNKPEIYYEILKRVKLRGENITDFAQKRSFDRANLKKALTGKWNGRKAHGLVLRICKELYIQPPTECLELEMKKEGA